MNPQKISDIWKALRKIYQMRPTIGIFSNFCRSYKQNKGIHAILEKVQQPVLHHGKKMRFIKKAPYRFFCNLLQWIYTSNGHVKLQKKSQLSQNEHEGMDSEQCGSIPSPYLGNVEEQKSLRRPFSVFHNSFIFHFCFDPKVFTEIPEISKIPCSFVTKRIIICFKKASKFQSPTGDCNC